MSRDSHPGPHLSKLDRLLLRFVLKAQKVIQGRLIDRMMIRAFGGVHPKNVFHYRTKMYAPYLNAQDRVIDLACGSGITLANLAPLVHSARGIELAPSAVTIAQARAVKLGIADRIKFSVGDILENDYAKLRNEFPYSVAVYSHILEHLDDPRHLIRKVAAPRIIICVPSEENWYRQLLKFLNLDHRSDPTHRCEYRLDTLEALIRESGYEPRVIAYNSEGELYAVADLG